MQKKILMVDDEEGLARLVKLNLEETGEYQVKTETNGTQALASVRAFQPDLILLDLMMPGKDGYEVAREIRADERIRNIPIVFLTAQDSREARKQVQEGILKEIPVIEKPISAEKLIGYIEKHLTEPPS